MYTFTGTVVDSPLKDRLLIRMLAPNYEGHIFVDVATYWVDAEQYNGGIVRYTYDPVVKCGPQPLELAPMPDDPNRWVDFLNHRYDTRDRHNPWPVQASIDDEFAAWQGPEGRQTTLPEAHPLVSRHLGTLQGMTAYCDVQSTAVNNELSDAQATVWSVTLKQVTTRLDGFLTKQAATLRKDFGI